MTSASRHFARLSALAVLGAGLSACATGLPNVQAGDVPRLQQEVASRPDDTDLQVQLGMAEFKAGDFETAQTTLQAAVDAGNESGAALLYLGMTEEQLENWSGARDAYTRYLTVGGSSATIAEVRKRLTLIGRSLLRAQAQQALAREADITGPADVTPQSIAVLPLAFNSDRQDLEPLIYALSDMMTTDFAASNALVVLERAQIQSLLDEMALTSSGYADAGTGARAGRLLKAQHVFQGVLTTLGSDNLQTEANVLDVPSTSSEGQVTEQAVLDHLFDMEKQLVIRTIREVLGVELTPAEEQAILENRMSNVLAFLAYGRGLRDIDRGDYEAAQAEFNTSFQLEPGNFPSRAAAASELSDLLDASSTTTADLSDLAGSTGELGVGLVAPPSAVVTQDLTSSGQGDVRNTLSSVTEAVSPTPSASTLDLGSTKQGSNQATQQTQDTNRDPVQESQGQETVPGTTGAEIQIVIQRPGA
jgi:tetratricopeptide (TPR) repeat protein